LLLHPAAALSATAARSLHDALPIWKEGLAAAYLAGFGRALSEGYDLVVEMDADLSHQPEELPSLLRAANGLDLVVGSRYVPGGSVTNWGRLRRMLSRGGNAYAGAMLGLPVRDAT